MSVDLCYFRNRSGLVAVSCDEGDTLILPTGKIMEFNEFWEDVEEDLKSQLTTPQDAALQRMIARIDQSEIGGIVRTYSRNKRIQERLDGVDHEPVYRTLSPDAIVVVADFD